MRTSIQILSGVAFAALLTFSSFQGQAHVNSPAMEVMEAKMPIHKVVVRGNVKVYIIQGKNESVSMEEQYMDQVSIKQVGTSLMIAGNTKDPIEVTVHVNDIYRIDAADEAVVSTLGKLKLKNLQVFLRDEAVAKINTNTESLYTLVNQGANLILKGSTDHHTLNYAGLKNISSTKFVALQTNHLQGYDLAALQSKAGER